MGLFHRDKTLNERMLEEAGIEPSTTPVPPHVDASDHALNYIHEHGGKVYVWLDDRGLSHTGTEPPDQPVEFVQLDADGFELHQDVTIATPKLWKIIYLPLVHRIAALYDGAVTVDGTSG